MLIVVEVWAVIGPSGVTFDEAVTVPKVAPAAGVTELVSVGP